MGYAALIGDPIKHSVAPLMHQHFAELSHMDFQYLKIRVSVDDLASSVAAMRLLGFSGCNITLPHKEDVARFVDRLEEPALLCGAVNTIVFKGNETVGFNTDWIGIVKALIFLGFPEKAARGRAVILGSGGAARAAIYALQQLKYEWITVLYVDPPDRKTARLLGQSKQLGVDMRTYDYLERVIDTAELVCNMTSAGMAGMSPSPFVLTRLDGINLEQKFFLDAVFNPVQTPMVQYFEQRGSVIVDGVWMTIFQGIPAFEAWNGKELELSRVQINELYMLMVNAIGIQA
ncbi:shikimate dehydrogenase [Actinomadura fulvescens]|uniref:Shikimate dehydrogenase (NADP(+)) n=1 Tax=Actinomadura fulvescens TaxID=46160 RepID=A0ABN3QFV7_9ACTN